MLEGTCSYMYTCTVSVIEDFPFHFRAVSVRRCEDRADRYYATLPVIRSTVQERLLNQHYFAAQWSVASLRKQTNAAAMAMTLPLSSYVLHPCRQQPVS